MFLCFYVLLSVVTATSSVSFSENCRIKSSIASRSDELHPMDLFSVDKLTINTNSKAQITVNITKTTSPKGGWVHVEWKHIKNPEDDDMVALYAVGEEDWMRKSPIKTAHAAESPSHMKWGEGELDVKLLNHRQDVRFVFLQSFYGCANAVAMSPVIKIAYKNAPLYVHLALTDTENEMSVQWVSGSYAVGFVKWGTSPNKLHHKARSISTTYTPYDVCGPPASREGYIFPGYMHNAVIPRLKPRQRYYYKFGSKEWGYSEVYNFLAPPPVGTEETVKIIAVADMGQYNIDLMKNPLGYINSLNTTENFNKEEDVDLLAHIGDISYAQGYVADWDVFFDQLQPLTTKVPYMVAMGNHERLYPGSGDRFDLIGSPAKDSGGECGVAYERRLQMPVPGHDKPYYAFRFASIHVIIFCTELAFEKNTEQYKFLKKELESVDRKLTPWVIVGFHRPMYPGITEDRSPRGYWYVGQQLQAALGTLFYKHNVDMLWSGHHHSYQRTCPVHKEKCVPFDRATGEARAPVQIVFGNAGAQLYHNLVKRPFIEYSANFFGYLRFFVNRTHLTMESISNEDLKVKDSVTLYKKGI